MSNTLLGQHLLDAVIDINSLVQSHKSILDQNIARAREAEEVDQILGKALGINTEDDCHIIQVASITRNWLPKRSTSKAKRLNCSNPKSCGGPSFSRHASRSFRLPRI